MNVSKMIEYLKGLPGDLPVYGVVGSSGAVYEASSPHQTKVEECDIDMGMDLEAGDFYVCIYLGN